MGKLFGYERGAVNYFFGSLTGNTVAMYLYGAGLLAIWKGFTEAMGGSFVIAVFDYFFTKHLPPTSVEQVIVQIVIGTGVASVKWYIFTPKRR